MSLHCTTWKWTYFNDWIHYSDDNNVNVQEAETESDVLQNTETQYFRNIHKLLTKRQHIKCWKLKKKVAVLEKKLIEN